MQQLKQVWKWIPRQLQRKSRKSERELRKRHVRRSFFNGGFLVAVFINGQCRLPSSPYFCLTFAHIHCLICRLSIAYLWSPLHLKTFHQSFQQLARKNELAANKQHVDLQEGAAINALHNAKRISTDMEGKDGAAAVVVGG